MTSTLQQPPKKWPANTFTLKCVFCPFQLRRQAVKVSQEIQNNFLQVERLIMKKM